MDILVIGGTRFFGARLVSRLLEEGHRVTILTRGKSKPAFWERVRHLEVDRKESVHLRAMLSSEHFDVVVDNIATDDGDVKAILGALGSRIGHYVLTSSVRVYDDTENLGILTEGRIDVSSIPLHYSPGSNPSEDYAVGKRKAELVLWENPAPCAFTVVRPSSVEGFGDPTGRSWFWIQRVADGGPVLLPREKLTPIFRHVCAEDAAKAIALCLGNARAFGRAFNIAGDEILSLFDYVSFIGLAVGRSARIVEAPYELIRRQREMGAFQAEYVDRRIPDIRCICELGFVPTPLHQWLEPMVRWYLAHPQPDSMGYVKRIHEMAAARVLGKP